MERTSLPQGVALVSLRVITDERGSVLQMLRCDAADFEQFGECYFSEVLPGRIKAWKRHRTQTQNLAVPVGRIRMVLFDDRAASATAGQVVVLELGRPDAYRRLTIPPGLWYGFGCLGNVPALIANCADAPHQPDESDTRPADDNRMPHEWCAQL